jgi:hypothetical protein
MTISIERLSIWEIAHRWHNADPSLSKTIEDIPLEVKDTLRNLAAEVFDERLYSTWLIQREAVTHKPSFIRSWPQFWRKKPIINIPVSYFADEFYEVMNNRLKPDFLKKIRIPIWEMEIWCKEYQIPFPDFWVRSVVLGGSKQPFPGAIEFIQDQETMETEQEDEISFEKEKSEAHSRAAIKRHEPVNQLKRKCVIFSLKEKGSNRQIANRFYSSLSNEEKKLVSEANSERLFSNAISAYKNGSDEDWLKDLPDS